MARQGKLILFSDVHAGMSEAELRKRQAQMDEALETAAADPDNVIVLYGDTLAGPFVPADPQPASFVDATITAFARDVRDRLSFFLEMIDRCDVLFSERVGERLVFLVCAAREEHLELIRNAIAGEHRMLDELGIDPRDIEVDRRMIRIRASLPETDQAVYA